MVGFVSVLAHEFGHAAMGKAFGLRPSIDLPGNGIAAGVTSFEATSRARVTPTRSVLISLAGPGLGLLLGAIFMIVRAQVPAPNAFVAYAFFDLVWINCGWGVINLIPALPLDGGNVMRTIVLANMRSDQARGERIVHIVSLVAIGLAGAYALSTQNYFAALMAAIIAYQNWKAIRGDVATRGAASR